MQKINFKDYAFRFKNTDNRISVFDEIRRKFIILTPEEWVRQHVIRYLLEEKKYPKSYINVEKIIKINGLTKRYDVVVFQVDGSIFLLVECKAPAITISQNTFDQIARYNMVHQVSLLAVSNGLQHYYCHIDLDKRQYQFIADLPDYVRAV